MSEYRSQLTSNLLLSSVALSIILAISFRLRDAAGAPAAVHGGAHEAAIGSVLMITQLHIDLHVSALSQHHDAGVGVGVHAALRNGSSVARQLGLGSLHLQQQQ